MTQEPPTPGPSSPLPAQNPPAGVRGPAEPSEDDSGRQQQAIARLILAMHDRDKDAAMEAIRGCVTDGRSAFSTLATLADLAGRPMANQREGDDMVVIDVMAEITDEHEPTLAAAQLVSTAANGQMDTMYDLVGIAVDRGEEFFTPTLWQVLSILVAYLDAKVPPESWQRRAAS